MISNGFTKVKVERYSARDCFSPVPVMKEKRKGLKTGACFYFLAILFPLWHEMSKFKNAPTCIYCRETSSKDKD